MITLKQESALVKKLKSLTELELQSVFEEFADHVYKNRLSEVIQRSLDIDDLREEYDNLESEFEELTSEKDGLENSMHDARRILEDIENIDDDVQKEIDKAIGMLDV